MARIIHINLLDWRAARRKQREKSFVSSIALTALVTVLLCAGTLMVVQGQVGYQNERNSFLKQQIKEVDKQIAEIKDLEKTKANLLARMRVIQELQKNRADIVHFFDEMVKLLPVGIYLDHVQMRGNNVSISGVAESNGYISTYLKNLDDSPYFANPRLIVIKTHKDKLRHVANFSIHVDAFPKKAEDADKGGK